jgi:membrane protease YdiL (CAAX protease family)
LGQLLGILSWRDCLVLAVLSGVSEEAFFRGALQPQLGLVATSALFGLAHLVPRRELAPWCLFSFAAGLLLGLLFERTGNLLAPSVAHIVVNAVNLRLLSVKWGGA